MIVRPVRGDDAGLLLDLARRCPPLDVHTPYTYWVICHYFGDTSFVAEDDRGPMAFVTGIVSGSTLFVWQIGVVPDRRTAGVAGILLEAIHTRTKELGLTRIETTITPDNGPSNALFSSSARRMGATFDMLDKIVVPEHEGEPPEILFCIGER